MVTATVCPAELTARTTFITMAAARASKPAAAMRQQYECGSRAVQVVAVQGHLSGLAYCRRSGSQGIRAMRHYVMAAGKLTTTPHNNHNM